MQVIVSDWERLYVRRRINRGKRRHEDWHVYLQTIKKWDHVDLANAGLAFLVNVEEPVQWRGWIEMSVLSAQQSRPVSQRGI